jgi:hypothetical protein
MIIKTINGHINYYMHYIIIFYHKTVITMDLAAVRINTWTIDFTVQ